MNVKMWQCSYLEDNGEDMKSMGDRGSIKISSILDLK